jgi:hypothetical protein
VKAKWLSTHCDRKKIKKWRPETTQKTWSILKNLMSRENLNKKMKKMKNLVQLFLVFIAITITTDALYAQKFGIKAGLNLSTMHAEDDKDGTWDDLKMNPGFHIGATAEFPITEMFSFETGLLLTTKGYKMSRERASWDAYESELNLLYLDIPLTAKASFDLGGTRIYGVFGPYLGIGLSGKFKSKAGPTEEDTGSYEYDIEWGSELKRVDFGLTMGAGVELNSIQIGLTYSLGLANISSYTDGGYKMKNRVLGISLGYRFGGK